MPDWRRRWSRAAAPDRIVIDAELGVLTELQVGSYVFMDREYGDCDLDGDGEVAVRHGAGGRCAA